MKPLRMRPTDDSPHGSGRSVAEGPHMPDPISILAAIIARQIEAENLTIAAEIGLVVRQQPSGDQDACSPLCEGLDSEAG